MLITWLNNGVEKFGKFETDGVEYVGSNGHEL